MTSEPPSRHPDFAESYLGTPPWDIGRPQRIFVELVDEGAVDGRVLDSGCGTGEHALLTAARGYATTGIDIVPAAIELARKKAFERNVEVTFEVGDVLSLTQRRERFDTVIDSGVFHVFDDADRARYVKSLRSALAAGGRYFMACFSEHQPGDWGPRRVTQHEIRASFDVGWRVESIDEALFETNLETHRTVRAWLARIVRV